MLEQPWPPPAQGPQQPRDAHRQHWANDARVRPGRGRQGPAEPWAGREHAVRRASDDVRLTGADDVRPADDAAGTRRDASAPDGAPAAPTRWEPEEEWIPWPRSAPEQRWTPEEDWLAAFGRVDAVAVAADAAARRRVRRRRLLTAAAGGVVVGALVLLVLAALAPVITVGA